MALCEIVLRVPHRDDEIRVAEISGGGDGSVISVDGRDWFVMMTMPPQGTEARRRLICVRVEGLS